MKIQTKGKNTKCDILVTSNKEKYKETIKKEGFKGGFGEFLTIWGNDKKVVVTNIDKIDGFRARELGAKIYKHIENLTNNKNVVFDFEKYEKEIIEGFLTASYKFDKYKTTKNVEKIENVVALNLREEEIKKIETVNNALILAKNLINEQASYMTPSRVSKVASEVAEKYKLEIKIYEKEEIEKMGLGAYLAVARGSEEAPKFIHLKYVPKNPVKKIALIGKGITFDAGGLDIKPATSMLDMKDDMSGCACILGVIGAIAKLKSNIEVHAISALCENMPSGRSYKQGDVLIAKNGKTIEVDNTDAEGRLTLADALCYADELGVDEIIDVATLTGAQIVALGSRISAIMGKNQKMIDKIIECGIKSGENLWQMPIMDEMKDNLQSNIADMKNTGGREAGTSTAGWFLSNFVKNKNWVHIDIAGTAHISKSFREYSKGATGVMVKTLINYILG